MSQRPHADPGATPADEPLQMPYVRSYFDATPDDCGATAHARAAAGLTAFDFASPALRCASAYAGGLALAWGAAAFMTPAALADAFPHVTYYLTFAVLSYDLLRVLGKSYRGPLSGLLPDPLSLDPLSREVLRRLGRRAFLAWHFTAPFWVLVTSALLCTLGLSVFDLFSHLWHSIPAPAPPRPRTPPALPVSLAPGPDDVRFAQTVRSMLNLCRWAILAASATFLLWGVGNFARRRPAGTQFLGAATSFGFILLAWAAESLDSVNDFTAADLGR